MNDVTHIVADTARQFKSFGGGKVASPGNPLSHWMKDEPPKFALGVSVEEVVRFVIERYKEEK